MQKNLAHPQELGEVGLAQTVDGVIVEGTGSSNHQVLLLPSEETLKLAKEAVWCHRSSGWSWLAVVFWTTLLGSGSHWTAMCRWVALTVTNAVCLLAGNV